MKIHAFQAHRKETDIKATFLVVLKREESLPRKKKRKKKKESLPRKKKEKRKRKKKNKKKRKEQKSKCLKPIIIGISF